MEVVLGMIFLAFGNINIEFIGLKKLIWRFYTAIEVSPTTNRVKYIDRRKFAKTALDKNSWTFVIYVAILAAKTLIYLSHIA